MPANPPTPRERRVRRLLGLTLGASGLTGGLIGAGGAIATEAPNPVAVAVIGAIAVATFAVALWATLAWWRSVDEAVRDAHKTGWFWGGSAGLVAVIGLVIALHLVGPDQDLSAAAMIPGDAGLIMTGLFAAMILQVIGYGVVWAVLWLWRGR